MVELDKQSTRNPTPMEKELQNQAVNTLRFLSADGVQKANSGHPGLPMGCAAIAYTIWTRHLRHNPADPGWADRDRFILSGGHGSMLLYSLLHLTGYDLSLDELKSFRQWGSRTPGHPEYGLTPGVELTTGPLGQGFAGGVGFAIAEAHLAAVYNRPGHKVIDHFVYAIVTDGDLMEGVASEAASLAGHLKLGKLIYLYDDNHITIDGSTDLSFSEDRSERFAAYDWQVLQVTDGNDVEEIDKAIQNARNDPRPSLIVCRTHIGFGLPTRQDTAKAHGEPPGIDELAGAKQKLGWAPEPDFIIPEQVLVHFRQAVPAGKKLEEGWKARFDAYRIAHPAQAAELDRRLKGDLPDGWQEDMPNYSVDPKGIATRAASGKMLNALAVKLPELMGGSADLTPSNNTWIETSRNFLPGQYDGRYVRFGVREHGMGAVVNGMAVHGGVIPYGATFLVFSDYMRGAVRLSALSHYSSIWIFTHDSIGLGEDGPTHQPVEHIASLRAIPNLTVIRPMDANETVYAWQAAIARRRSPTVLLLTRQAVPVIDREEFAPAKGLLQGAYVLKDLGTGKPQLILMASGSEVQLIVEAGRELEKQGIPTRLVSFPSWELFSEQAHTYQVQVLPTEIQLRIAIEAGVAQGWERWVGERGRILSIEKFGASAPFKTIFEKYGLTSARVVEQALDLLGGR
jgi:transketolase